MGITWSDDQLKVINLRNRDILVSAAAGSGKTTVLVERIIRRITDPTDPIDIDELLVVTFTKAAAGEMKERIGKALDDLNLRKQSALVPHAQITTIDSFCLFVIRNYFEEINLDPNFRVADETEGQLLVKDMLKELFDAEYAVENPDFLALIDQYADARSDAKVRDMVEKIYQSAQSAAWPKKWMNGLLEDDTEKRAIQKVVDLTVADIQSAIRMAQLALEICMSPSGNTPYCEAFQSDLEMLRGLEECKTFQELQKGLSSLKYQKLSSSKCETASPELKEKVKAIREKYKKQLDGLKKTYFFMSEEEILAQQQRVFPYMKTLVNLAIKLDCYVREEKKKRHMVDFSDMEHLALSILVDEETGQARPAAEEFRKHFKEIMIDEYQDSNEVQEAILTAISGHEQGNYNMFMVGDVKQSIYRFRMAKPELFIGKYESYSKEDSKQQRIDLQCNYRSREGVLDFCNDIFYKLMNRELGGVEYDDEAKLNYGAKYPDSEEPCAEVLIFNKDEINEQLSEEEQENDKIKLEARMVAHRILDLHRKMQIRDKRTEEMRGAEFSDIVILLRSIKTAGPIFVETLEQYGIPAHVDSTTGYFDATEVNLILNFLRLIDNPYQDIPMAALLKSPIVQLTDEDLAEIKIEGRKEDELPKAQSFAEAALRYLKANEHPFYDLLLELRSRKDLSVHEMIQLIFRRTGYDSYVAALPGGKTRYANLTTLVEKAMIFEQTSYKGIFHFLRYIAQMRKYEKDFGEADAEGENGDVVHIKTIHKSKGLEYPIVFVSGMSKNFNMQDEKGDMLLHPELGMAMREIYGNPRKKKDNIMLSAIKNYLHLEALGEEMRILYVALTRAKEKLILTGVAPKKEIETDGILGFGEKAAAKCYYDWILPILYQSGKHDYVKELDQSYFEKGQQEQTVEKMLAYGEVCDKIDKADSDKVQLVLDSMAYQYPYQADVSRKSKYSVSEIKHESMKQRYDALEGEVETAPFLLQEKDPYIPAFARTAQEQDPQMPQVSAGALFGTAVHRMMEVLDFAQLAKVDFASEEQLRVYADTQLAQMKESGELEEALFDRLHGGELLDFLKSPIAESMAKAAAAGELYREKPFVMQRKDGTLVQGIIDVFWKTDEGMVLLDYKTDRVEQAQELILRYEEQLLLYKDALEKLFGPVSRTLIYSFRLKEVISI